MKRRKNNSQIVLVIVLAIGVLGLSIGFAAFSNVLIVKPGVIIDPNSTTFNVDFSSSSTGVVETEIVPILNPSTLNARSAVIDNTTDPTITGFKVDFTAPNQSAVYKFYAYNAGRHNAYLKSIQFLNVENEDSHKVCKTIYGTNEQEVLVACDDITLTLTIGSITTSSSVENITGNLIKPGESHEILVTVKYLNSAKPINGDFSARFGSIKLEYSSIEDSGDSSLITFTVDGVRYQALPGMTWMEWWNSEYNPDYGPDMLPPEDYYGLFGWNGGYVSLNNRGVEFNEVIVANGNYIIEY